MLVLLCVPVAIVAAVGFLASVAVNLSFWAGAPVLPQYHDLLFMGIFVVHVPTVLLLISMSPAERHPRSWKEWLRGAPVWVLPAFYGVFGYAFVNFALGFLGVFDMTDENFFRVGSSHAMVFYFMGFAVNIAAIGRRNEPPLAPCERGHEMPREAAFCATCGAARRGAARGRG
jgi:hypothetical protein